jgi:hypothetical protein
VDGDHLGGIDDVIEPLAGGGAAPRQPRDLSVGRVEGEPENQERRDEDPDDEPRLLADEHREAECRAHCGEERDLVGTCTGAVEGRGQNAAQGTVHVPGVQGDALFRFLGGRQLGEGGSERRHMRS